MILLYLLGGKPGYPKDHLNLVRWYHTVFIANIWNRKLNRAIVFQVHLNHNFYTENLNMLNRLNAVLLFRMTEILL